MDLIANRRSGVVLDEQVSAVANILGDGPVQRRLAERGIASDVEDIESEGIPDTLGKHGLSWDALGLWGCTVYYRRRLEDMKFGRDPRSPQFSMQAHAVRKEQVARTGRNP